MDLCLLSRVDLGVSVLDIGRFSNYVKLGSFSPDGSCLSSVTSDNIIRVYPAPKDSTNIATTIESSINISLKDDIRDLQWFPNFDWNNPDSCCIVTATKNNPVHLYDVCKGVRHFSYRAVNAVGELADIHSLCFHPLGKYLIAGSINCIYVFDVEMPGEHIEVRRLSTRRGGGQRGIISSIAHNTFRGAGTIYACGSYNSSIGIYDHNESRYMSTVGDFDDPENPLGPITHVKWFNEYTLIVGCRNDFFIRSYDIRGKCSAPTTTFHRPVANNQKITFDIHYNKLISGTTSGDILVYDVLDGVELYKKNISGLPVTCCSVHPELPLVLTGNGTRHFQTYNVDSDSESKVHDNVNLTIYEINNNHILN